MDAEEMALIEVGAAEDTALDEETLTEIEALSEQLALHSIESEARHEQILEGVAENHQCLLRLEQSSTTENPVSQALVTDLATLKTELAEVKGMLTAITASLAALNLSTRQASQSQSESPNPPQPPTENPAEHAPGELTEEPAPEERRPKHRIL